mgnify:FL=1
MESDLKFIGPIENAIEAEFICSLFEEQKIPFHLKSFYDSAYDGLFTKVKGYGELFTTEEYYDTGRELYENYYNSMPQ